MLSVLVVCCNSKVKPAVAPRPGMAGGATAITRASLISAVLFLISAITSITCWPLDLRWFQCLSEQNKVPAFDLLENVTTLKPASPPTVFSAGISRMRAIRVCNISTLRLVDVASGIS